MESKAKNINSHWIALYDKFMIAFSCILMFFIGAPLGSIIRKGGLGLPIVFAVAIFIVFHFINTFGKRVAQENQMPAFMGVWMSSMILTPLALLLTYRAINDIGGMITFDVITEPIKKVFTSKKTVTIIEPVSNSITKPRIVDETPVQDASFELTAYHKSIKILFALYALLCALSVVLF